MQAKSKERCARLPLYALLPAHSRQNCWSCFLSRLNAHDIPRAQMDIVGATASIAQLAAYCKSACQHLWQVYKAVRNGPAAFSDQSLNISILLNIIDRVRNQESFQERVILPLLVDISTLACKIHSLLERRGLFGLHWALFTKCEALSEAFTSLSAKRDLLHLHISERNHNNLSQIQIDIARMSSNFGGPGYRLGSGTIVQQAPAERIDKEEKMGNKSEPSTQKAPPSGATINANRSEAGTSSRLILGNGYAGNPDIKYEDAKLHEKAKGVLGNRGDNIRIEGNDLEITNSGSSENAGKGTRTDRDDKKIKDGKEVRSGNAHDKH
ncbi:hypothetical protein EV356DRAFT_506169 [Viridothelium virens]|uniref:Uncharacterized protein n=1 Tax=Viridothelium virens TaxID=1048519 RepID=A0A6A6H359_VIRVR|nr:hypothetical protein EV356DRAFT_506169 [Viridothelium virens]